MRSTLLKLLVLLPIPVVVWLVWWAGKRPVPPPLKLKHHGKGGAASHGVKAVSLPLELKPGWRVQGKVEQYDKKTLFDRIDGAAPAYIRAGFVYSLGAEFRRQGMKESVVADLYDMGSAARGLGMYATERDRSYSFIEVGDEGYLASGSLNFYKGRFYVKLAGYEEGKEMDQALTELATGLAVALPDSDGKKELASLALLPKKGRVANSDGYSHPPLGDVEGLDQVFYAEFQQGETTYRLFVARPAGEKAAGQRYERIKSYFEKDGAKIEESTEGAAKLLKAAGDSTTSVLVRAGALLAGAIDLEDAALVPAVQKQLLAAASGPEVKQEKNQEKPK